MADDRKRTTPALCRHLARTVAVATALVLGLAAPVFVAQQPAKPAAPGTPGDPTWQRVVRLNDGRTFVTDGGLTIDAAIAKPAVLPTEVLSVASGKVVEGYLTATLKDEFSLAELKRAATGHTYTAPSGVVLNGTYINFLRRILPEASLGFRMEGDLTPVVVVSKGMAVGVLMPVRR